MKRTSKLAQEARHYRARMVSHRLREYTLFPGVPSEAATAPKDGGIIIAGEVNSGRTYAMLVVAVHLAKTTPLARKGKKNLIRLIVEKASENWVYATLAALMKGSDKLDLCPTAKSDARWLFQQRGCDLLVEDCEGVALSKQAMDGYEVVHVLYEGNLMPQMRSVKRILTPTGLRVSTATLPRFVTGEKATMKDVVSRVLHMATLTTSHAFYLVQRVPEDDSIQVLLERHRRARPGGVFALPPVPVMRFE